MNQKCAIVKALLNGQVLSIMNGFTWFGCTNLPREISRSVEQDFGVQVSRIRVEHTSKYGETGSYYQYRLNRTEYNKHGIALMEKYVEEIERKPYSPPVKRGPKVIHPKVTIPQPLDLFTQ